MARLKETLLMMWQNMDETIVDNMIKSMKDKIQTMQLANGAPASYHTISKYCLYMLSWDYVSKF